MADEKRQSSGKEPEVVSIKGKKETEAPKQAFELYYSMGAKRSLEAVASACNKSTRTIGVWSRQFKLIDRFLLI